MSVVSRTIRTATRAVKGVATSTSEVPTAALVASAIGLFGLIEWPIVVGVGAGALVLQRINRTDEEDAPDAKAPLASVSGNGSNGSAPRKSTTSAAKKTTRRRASTP